jgi:hypothetical protein
VLNNHCSALKPSGYEDSKFAPVGFASPTKRRGKRRALAEPICGVSDKGNEVFASQKMAD